MGERGSGRGARSCESNQRRRRTPIGPQADHHHTQEARSPAAIPHDTNQVRIGWPPKPAGSSRSTGGKERRVRRKKWKGEGDAEGKTARIVEAEPVQEGASPRRKSMEKLKESRNRTATAQREESPMVKARAEPQRKQRRKAWKEPVKDESGRAQRRPRRSAKDQKPPKPGVKSKGESCAQKESRSAWSKAES